MPPSDFVLDSSRSSFSQTNKNWLERLLPRPSTQQTLTHMWNSFSSELPLLSTQDTLDLSFWSFLTFLHHSIKDVKRHLLWKLHTKIRRKSWSKALPKLLACIGFLYKVVHKIGRLRKFNCAREIEFNFFTAWAIFMKLGTLVQHAPGYKTLPQIF